MSQRAACQLDRYGFAHVSDFVYGKAHWLASGRATVRATHGDRVLDHLNTDVHTIDADATVADVIEADIGDERVVVVAGNVVLGTLRATGLTAVDPGAPVTDVMHLGPTTVRPDELASAVRERMVKRNVTSVLVTEPTGELLGRFDA